jgi:hypothetical protein
VKLSGASVVPTTLGIAIAAIAASIVAALVAGTVIAATAPDRTEIQAAALDEIGIPGEVLALPGAQAVADDLTDRVTERVVAEARPGIASGVLAGAFAGTLTAAVTAGAVAARSSRTGRMLEPSSIASSDRRRR